VKEYQQLEWHTNEILQLQHLPHEGIGKGTWSKAEESIPITEAGQILATLDISEPAHPKLDVSPIGSELTKITPSNSESNMTKYWCRTSSYSRDV
jgi:hypothetical protein